jgi:hypothetical protein
VLFPIISRTLGGTAAHWFTQLPMRKGLTLRPIFKRLFLARFGGKETATSALMKMLNESPLKDEPTGSFGIRLQSLLETRWANLTMAEVIYACVLFRQNTVAVVYITVKGPGQVSFI